MAENACIEIEVAYAKDNGQYVLPVRLATPAALRDAIVASGILTLCPEIDLGKNKTGIFGLLAPLETLLKSGDRVEIYRPLAVNPMQKRRERAALVRSKKRGGK